MNADEPAVLEGLRRAPRSQVVVRHRFDEVELVSEFLRQRLRGVTDDGETAASPGHRAQTSPRSRCLSV